MRCDTVSAVETTLPMPIPPDRALGRRILDVQAFDVRSAAIDEMSRLVVSKTRLSGDSSSTRHRV